MTLFLTIVATTFWLSLFLVVYAYALYPPLIWAVSHVFGRQPIPEASSDRELPKVSLLIAAYNEESEIAGRVRNALALDYPRNQLEVVVGSDGSTDATNQIVRQFADEGVRLLGYELRRGKASVLNASMPELTGEIVVLSDANTLNDPAAVRCLARWFRDPQVGAVCGRLILTDPVTGRNADSLYWKYETFLKRCEGRLGALLGANGAIYAIRRTSFTPIPAETIVDDFVIPLVATLRTGCSIVFDADAIAFEETPSSLGAEFHRRSRIGAGGFQSVTLLWKLLDPRRGWIAFTFFSHKILRWVCPFLLIGLVASNVALAANGLPLYRALMAAQVAFYLSSLVSACLPPGYRLLKPLRIAAMFTGMNAALLLGCLRWMRGIHAGTWTRTARVAETSGASR